MKKELSLGMICASIGALRDRICFQLNYYCGPSYKKREGGEKCGAGQFLGSISSWFALILTFKDAFKANPALRSYFKGAGCSP